jgi:hypothetical protein
MKWIAVVLAAVSLALCFPGVAQIRSAPQPTPPRVVAVKAMHLVDVRAGTTVSNATASY